MIDLHTHTNQSDGEKTPEELIDYAISKGITALAITDHDTIDGLQDASNYVENKEIIFIPGIELDTKVEKGKMHILGLYIDYKNEEFNKIILDIQQERHNRNLKFIEEFNKMGFEVTLEELQEVGCGKFIGKPHFAKVFVKKGYIQTKAEIFDKYFNQPPLSNIKKTSLNPKEVITMIKKANGIAVLAHPQTLKLGDNELLDKIKELKSYGLDGLECYHSAQTPEQMKRFKEMAQKLNLLITKGSDYHGPITKPEVELGIGTDNNIVLNDDEEILTAILNCRKN